MCTPFPKARKISLFGHDGTPAGKANVLQKLVTMLSGSAGYIMEASGAVSWALRKSGLTPITDHTTIVDLLNLDQLNASSGFEEQNIHMNTAYVLADKNSQVYVHTFVNKLTQDVMFSNPASLFGSASCS